MKKSTIILSSLVAILFVAVLYLLYQNNTRKQDVIYVAKTGNLALPTSSSSSALDPTSEWKTYTSPTENFSFNYPSTYTADDKTVPKDLFVMLKGNNYKVVSNDFGSKNTGSYYYFGINLACEPLDIVGNKSIVYSTQNYTIYSITGFEGPDFKSALIKNHGLCYEMTCSSDTKCDGTQLEEFKKILSTFKFSNQATNNAIPSSILDLFNTINQKTGEKFIPKYVSMDYFFFHGAYSTQKVWQLDLTKIYNDKAKISLLNNIFVQSQLNDSGGSGEGGNAFVYTYSNQDIECTLDSHNSVVKLSCLNK